MSAAKITEFKLGKGRTDKVGEMDFTKKYLEFTVRMPEQYTPEDLDKAMLAAEYTIDNWLGGPETPQIPEFDSELLMEHKWKGKKTGEKAWNEGTLAWGWDFIDQFPETVIQVLKKGPLVIDRYEFTLGENMVSVKEKKEDKRGRR